MKVTAPDGKHGYMSTTYLVLDHTEGSASEATSSVVESRPLRDQPFRIYRAVPELDKITVYARHVFYDLLDDMIKSYKPSSSAVGASVVQTISSSCLSEHDFTFYSDLTVRPRVWSLKTAIPWMPCWAKVVWSRSTPEN